MSGGSQQPSQTTRVELTPLQEQLMGAASPGLISGLSAPAAPFVAQPSFQAFTPTRWAGGFNQLQATGQQKALDSASWQDLLGLQGAQGLGKFSSGDIWNPEHNANLQGAIDAAVRPVYENLDRSTLSKLRDEAVSGGGFGGSRQGIAEGLAESEAGKTAGDISSKMAMDLYKTNVDAQLRALGMTGAMQEAQLAGAKTVGAVGDVQKADEAAVFGTDEARRYFDYQQEQARQNREYENTLAQAEYTEKTGMLPFLRGKELLAAVQGIPGAGTTTTANVPLANRLLQGLGGAATGAALGSALFPGVGTAVGALGGASLPFLFGGR